MRSDEGTRSQEQRPEDDSDDRHQLKKDVQGRTRSVLERIADGIPDNSRTGDLEDVGHYTQLMWRDTDRVGCAVEANGEYDILVCRYAAAGNVIGERPF